MRAIANLTAVLLATSAVAEPLNFDACEKIQDSREYAHCIATLGAAGEGKKSSPTPARAEPAQPQQPQAEAPEKEAPAPRVAAKGKMRGGRVVMRAAARGGSRVRAQFGPRPQKPTAHVRGKPAHVQAKPASRRGKGRR